MPLCLCQAREFNFLWSLLLTLALLCLKYQGFPLWGMWLNLPGLACTDQKKCSGNRIACLHWHAKWWAVHNPDSESLLIHTWAPTISRRFEGLLWDGGWTSREAVTLWSLCNASGPLCQLDTMACLNYVKGAKAWEASSLFSLSTYWNSGCDGVGGEKHWSDPSWVTSSLAWWGLVRDGVVWQSNPCCSALLLLCGPDGPMSSSLSLEWEETGGRGIIANTREVAENAAGSISVFCQSFLPAKGGGRWTSSYVPSVAAKIALAPSPSRTICHQNFKRKKDTEYTEYFVH